jgi:integrase/recombinase XerD
LSWARRLEIVRGFARYRFIFDPATEIPPVGLLGPAYRRVTPYIYSEQEIADLMDTATQLLPINGLRPASLRHLIGLLAATGMRPSEALRLTRADVDLVDGLITIRATKFHKSRRIPLHASTTAALQSYCAFRDRQVLLTENEAFFLLDGGRPLTYRKAAYAFARLRELMGWGYHHADRLPRLYDLRHFFVCRRLLDWYAEGVDIDQVMPFLSTYLGHVKVSDTYLSEASDK